MFYLFLLCVMWVVLYIILSLILWGALWYTVAYTRYGDAQVTDELRDKYKQVVHDYEQQQIDHKEILEQNRILKQQAQILLHQNEDFTKMVSELSRYYYRIKQGSLKLKELVDIMGVYDEQMEQKLVQAMGDDPVFEKTYTLDTPVSLDTSKHW